MDIQGIRSMDTRMGIGLMSGTSCDGIDAALVQLRGTGPALKAELAAFETFPYEDAFRSRLLAGGFNEDTLCALHWELGARFAEAAESLARDHSIDFVASHGHTLAHQPPPQPGYPGTLQLGEAAVIAERLGCPVVSDFRPNDMAAGGQGAPLVPYADWVLFRKKGTEPAVAKRESTKMEGQTLGSRSGSPVDGETGRVVEEASSLFTLGASPDAAGCRVYESRPAAPLTSIATLNIGGIANLTLVTPDLAHVTAFDTGPGNMIIDGAVGLLTDGAVRMDQDGAAAARGTVVPELLDRLLAHPYLDRTPPKSTGREDFGPDTYLRPILAEMTGLADDDIIATVTAAVARSIADGFRRFLAHETDVAELIVGGGGAYNPTLMDLLRQELPATPIRLMDECGIPSDAREAMAFAILGNETLCGTPSNVPNATGARRPVVLGKVTWV